MNEPLALARRPLILELGCGGTKRDPGAVGVDLLDAPGVDIVGDALEVLRSLPDGSVRAIHSEHFLEHLPDAEALVREAARVLEPGGEFRAVVPHFSNPHFYSDPTHRTFFGLYTFSYWVASVPWRRQTPQYDRPMPLALVDARFHFKSTRPFYVRHGIKKLLSSWVNTSRWTKEFYEENLTWLMPAYEVEYVLVRD
jgi:ubiquinone/menaquinone biosynthesis C-methylase UbiE